MSLAARELEMGGIPTVVLGCAKDIVEHVGVPRFLFSHFPLGNAAGRPHDIDSQDFTLELALQLLESAVAGRTTLRSPLRWCASPAWRDDYSNVRRLSAAEIARRREEFRAGLDVARQKRLEDTGR